MKSKNQGSQFRETSIKTVPNQRIIDVNKAKADKAHLYTVNTLDAIDEAASELQSAGGFKLYIYLAKNQDQYTFALSSSDFMIWSGLGKTAYMTAFAELVNKGYLIQSDRQKNRFAFYDVSQKKQKEDDENIIVSYPYDEYMMNIISDLSTHFKNEK